MLQILLLSVNKIKNPNFKIIYQFKILITPLRFPVINKLKIYKKLQKLNNPKNKIIANPQLLTVSGEVL